MRAVEPLPDLVEVPAFPTVLIAPEKSVAVREPLGTVKDLSPEGHQRFVGVVDPIAGRALVSFATAIDRAADPANGSTSLCTDLGRSRSIWGAIRRLLPW